MRRSMMAVIVLMMAMIATPAVANTTCKISYRLSGWSVFYKTANGTGTVSCSNGQRMAVRITAKGGGLTVGKYRIDNGFGQFASVSNIRDVLGSYITAEAHASADESASAQAMTNGKVSLALSGRGEGWSLGVAFSKFTIKAR